MDEKWRFDCETKVGLTKQPLGILRFCPGKKSTHAFVFPKAQGSTSVNVRSLEPKLFGHKRGNSNLLAEHVLIAG
jgi:hypothetical protein